MFGRTAIASLLIHNHADIIAQGETIVRGDTPFFVLRQDYGRGLKEAQEAKEAKDMAAMVKGFMGGKRRKKKRVVLTCHLPMIVEGKQEEESEEEEKEEEVVQRVERVEPVSRLPSDFWGVEEEEEGDPSLRDPCLIETVRLSR